jgi:predicted TPR repeat methyltransferase
LLRSTRVFQSLFGALLPSDKSARILDVGCGYGRFVWYLRNLGFAQAFGIDISQEQVDAAESLGLANTVTRADAHDYLAGHPAEFDLITALDLLEHLSKDEIITFLCLARESLRSGGRIMLQTTNAVGPFAGNYFYGDFTHQTAFSARSIRQILRATGFDLVRVMEVEPVAHGPASAVRRVLWRGLRGIMVAYLAIETGVARGHILSQNLVATARRVE